MAITISTATIAGMKEILVVDDEKDIVDAIEYNLKNEGFKVAKSYDGLTAVKMAREKLPVLIILDLMLPKAGGFEVLRELQEGDTSGIPIVLVSGRHMDRSTFEMLKRESNVKEFLEKPLNPPTNFISSGLYLIDPKVREFISEELAAGKKFLMTEKDLFPKLAELKKLAAYKSDGKWFDCGNLERWEKAIKEWG